MCANKSNRWIAFVVFTLMTFTFDTIVSDSSCDVWPKPTTCIQTDQQYLIHPDLFTFKYQPKWAICDLFANLLDRYESLLFTGDCSHFTNHQRPRSRSFTFNRDDSIVSTLEIEIVESNCPLLMPSNPDESYSITIQNETAVLSSNQIWGTIRGMETFAQLIKFQQVSQDDGQFVINNTWIEDKPRFAFRGFLVDTSRHFISLPNLFQFLDAMAYNKMNIFHWHIVDDSSFPYASIRYPSMTRQGRFSAKHVYSQLQIAQVRQYARLLGIRVLVEFDTPGHTLSWKAAQEGLLTECYKNEKPDGTFGPIDPTKEANYVFLQNFFQEIDSVFPDAFIHLGGDEVPFECWKSNPNINDFMKKNNLTTYNELESFYFQKLVGIVNKLNRDYLVWQEVFDNNVQLESQAIINVWKENDYHSELSNVTAKGFRAVLSSPWYLNYISYGIDWPKYYQIEPTHINGSQAQKDLIIGGSACMWSEYVDSTNLISRSWARGSAVAERLWSSENVTDIKDATRRIKSQRCRMLDRGLKVEPINGPGFCQCDYLI